MSNAIHPTAFISPSAQLGDNVTIGPCAVVEDNVTIGDNCTIDAFASIKQYTRMGKGNTIHSYAMVGGIPQDLKFQGEESWLEIGDNNTIREFATLHRGTDGGGRKTVIGSNCLLMAYSHVAHDCKLGDGVIMSNSATLAGHVTVGSHTILSGLSAVHQFVQIGEHAFLGGMTGISLDLPPYMLATGVRGGIRGPNIIGLRRMSLPPQAIAAIRQAFKTIWLSGIPRQEALLQVEEEYPDIPAAQRIVEFVRESERGVLSAVRHEE